MRYRSLLCTPPGLILILSLSACGSEQPSAPPAGQPADRATPTATVAPSSSSPATSLTVKVRPSSDAPATTWTLTCDPAGGDHPKAKRACKALAKADKPFKPLPPNQICTEIYGGPQVATVTGTWRGETVKTTFTRKNGCELGRWRQLSPLLDAKN